MIVLVERGVGKGILTSKVGIGEGPGVTGGRGGLSDAVGSVVLT